MQITLHAGDVAVTLLQVFGPAVAGAGVLAFWWAVKQVAPQYAAVLHQNHIDTLLYNAINAGIAKTEGAAVGQTMTITIANSVLAAALDYLDEHAEDFIKLYGPRVESMLISRLAPHLPPEASAANLGVAHS